MRAWLLAALVFAACAPVEGIPGTQVRMALDGEDDLFAAPFPSDHLKSGSVVRVPPLPTMQFPVVGPVVEAFTEVEIPSAPNPLVVQLQGALQDMTGFSTTSGVFFAFDGALRDPPSTEAERHAVARLVDVTPDSPTFLASVPIEVEVRHSASRYAPQNLVSFLPLQGRPLLPGTTYAALILREWGDVRGEPLGVPAPLRAVILDIHTGEWKEDAFRRYRRAVDALSNLIDPNRIAALAVFSTQDPTAELHAAWRQMSADEARFSGGFQRLETYPDFCVLRGEARVPVLQHGLNPYLVPGSGAWRKDASGRYAVARSVRSRVFLTIPRRPSPEDRYPVAVFIRTGGGGDRPLIDRGVRAVPGGPAVEPGSGIARELAREGFVGVTWDGPHGGLRNVGDLDEQFLVFNFANLIGLRDNVRQSALEGAWIARALDNLDVDLSVCPGAEASALDTERLALIGHSMGATIAPLTAAIEPRYEAMVLSGAGGSWIQNLIHKTRPLPVRRVSSALLGYLFSEQLEPHDPILSLVQWAGEAADPQAYARQVSVAPRVGLPRHVLMIQGIEDRYIPPPVANALSLAFPLELAGDALESSFPSARQAFGGVALDYPAALNGLDSTAVVVQHGEDGIEGGHEVFFQKEEPKRQLRWFLRTWRQGRPEVEDPQRLSARGL